MGATRDGIYYNLDESHYEYNVSYGEQHHITYVFSSRLNLKKFNDRLEENRSILTYSLFNRFNCWLLANELYDIVLYSKIEKRGFLIKVNGVSYKCLKNLKLGGVRKIENR